MRTQQFCFLTIFVVVNCLSIPTEGAAFVGSPQTAATTTSSSSSNQGFTCEHFGVCPGCVITDDVRQIEVAESSKRFFESSSIRRHRIAAAEEEDDLVVFPIHVPSKVTQWRTQAKLAVAPNPLSWGSRGGCIFGLYERNSHRVVPIPNCVVHHPQINKAIAILTEATANAQTVAYNHTLISSSTSSSSSTSQASSSSSTGQLRYVQCQVERSTNRVCLTLVWNAEQFKSCQPYLARLVKELKRLAAAANNNTNEDGSFWHSIWLHLNSGTGNNIFSRGESKWFCLEGPEFVREPILLDPQKKHGLLFFTPSTFRQANMDGFDRIAKHVAKSIPTTSTVCELYAGVGLLGLTALAYHHRQDNNNTMEGLRWLRCSDENPANLNCFERSLRSMSPSLTGIRSSSTSSSKKQQHQLQKQRYSSKASTSKATYMVASATKAIQEGQALGASVLIVDPPRSGLDDFVVAELCKPINLNQPYAEDKLFLEDDVNCNLVNDVTTLIYVSCGFEAFSRDCERLLSANAGWKIHSTTGYILFPGSNHIETVAIFKRKATKPPQKQRGAFSSNRKTTR